MSTNSSLQPIQLFTIPGSVPNPPKIALLLEALNIPWDKTVKVADDPTDPNDIKHSNFTKYNPNGRVPVIIDPNNNNLIVWESAAILIYLSEKYDLEGKFYPKDNLEDKIQVITWISHQISGIGPIIGQYYWFKVLHEKHWDVKATPDVIGRFEKEIYRLFGVLESQLRIQKEKGSDWLVLNRPTIAEFALHSWLKLSSKAGVVFDDYPLVEGLVGRIGELEYVKSAWEKLYAE